MFNTLRLRQNFHSHSMIQGFLCFLNIQLLAHDMAMWLVRGQGHDTRDECLCVLVLVALLCSPSREDSDEVPTWGPA